MSAENEDTQPGDRIARIEAAVNQIKDDIKSVVAVNSAPPVANADGFDEVSAEFKFSPTGNHIVFTTHGAFWTKLLMLGWRKASATKKMQLVLGAIGGQGVLLSILEVVRHLVTHAGK